MGSLSWQQWVRRLSRPFRAPTYRRPRPPTYRPGLEFLEQRLAPANWSGDIPNGTVWSNSQVQVLTGNVHVPAGSTLTIQPGTIVESNLAFGLTVDGTLNANGTAAQQIIFTSARDASVGGTGGAGNGDWVGLRFNAGSAQGLRSTDRPYSSRPIDFVKGQDL
jgi:hypothetical protein